jgi:polysaccharide deacetylase 2 family uncharacterized protein YibQ
MNNHMGSAVTQDAEKIAQALEGLRPYTTNFVDSNTSPNTVAFATCNKTEGFRCGLNRKFLDNENDHDYIKGKLTEAVALAKQQGSVIAIGHLRPDTIAVLEEMIPRLQAQGISFVAVNAVLQ